MREGPEKGEGPLNLKSKFMVVTAAVVTVVLGLYGILDVRAREKEAVLYDLERGALVGEIIKNSLVTLMVEGRGRDLRKFIEPLVADDLSAVRLYSPDGAIIASSVPGESGLNIPASEIVNTPRIISSMEGRVRVFELWTPFYNEGSCQNCHADPRKLLAVLSVSLSSAHASGMVQMLREGTFYFFLTALLVMLVSVSIATTFLVRRPIVSLADAVRRFRGGLKDARVPALGRDEIGVLGAELDALMRGVERECREREIAHEESLRQMEKMANVGELAATVAHQIKNPLAGISGAIQVLAEDMPEEDPRRHVISEVLGEIDRLDRTIRDLLYFSRPPVPSFVTTPLGELLDHTVAAVRGQLTRKGLHGTINFVPSGSMAHVSVDPGQFQQVFMYIVTSAFQAIPEGGTVTVDVETDKDCRIRFRDNGPGMTSEEIEGIFKPYAGRKNLDAGLALAIGKNIVEAHGGTLEVESRQGEGTTLTLTLPLAEERRDA